MKIKLKEDQIVVPSVLLRRRKKIIMGLEGENWLTERRMRGKEGQDTIHRLNEAQEEGRTKYGYSGPS